MIGLIIFICLLFLINIIQVIIYFRISEENEINNELLKITEDTNQTINACLIKYYEFESFLTEKETEKVEARIKKSKLKKEK